MQRTCRNSWCRSSFVLPLEEREFLRRMAFTFGDVRVDLPEPTWCPACRLQIRAAHRNERFLSKRTSDLSDADMVSLYEEIPPWGAPYKVFRHDEWHADTWDAMEYGRPYDFQRPFFAQWAELHKAVPRMGLITVGNENCDFTTGTGYCKNCYLINSSEYCEDCYYGKLLQNCKDCVDCSYAFDCELCHDCIVTYDCYACVSLAFSKNCRDCAFSTGLTGCSDCLLCSNLTQKQYHIRNVPVSMAEFEHERSRLRGSYAAREALRREWRDIERTRIHRAANIVQCEDCTGDYLEHARGCHHCFDVTDSQDCLHVYTAVKVSDDMHCANMYLKVELCYESLGALEVYHSAYCLFCFYSQNLLYCEYCLHCRDCFGCNGLKHKQYCIFNRQHTKEEYEALVPRIIEAMRKNGGGAMNRSPSATLRTGCATGSWGQFFPAQYAPFGYNESLANEYFPLTKEQALAQGFLWRDVVDRVPEVTKVIPARMLPDAIADIPDDVQNWAVMCEASNRPFRITKQELAYYRNMHLPLPRKHPDVRYDERLAWRNPRTLWDRTCAQCGKAIQTTYQPSRPEIVYCESCYLQAVH